MILIEPPYTEPYVRWCERTGVNRSLLLDLEEIIFTLDGSKDSPFYAKGTSIV
ncbi:hypothetical protein HMPREF1015_02830 [Bacillus smithii 7_3_47FAA]|uniref:Uncharacterized protein n=1 Tax=Bacillus smithii 7_3_47FAA TaxID=665952 RepID=G9QN58_9BACI|nr:hypothetical protein HMPREF1015_02830 [Bacillus smithii 7_3_47FAA]